MTIRDLLAVLRRHRVVALAVLVSCLAAGAAAAFIPAPTYRAEATLFVQPKSSATTDSYGAVEAARFLQPALADLIETASFRSRVRARLPPEIASTPVSLTGNPEFGSPILRVTAHGKVPTVTETWANAAAQELIASNPSALVAISVIDPARRPITPSGPLRVPLLLGSAVLGVILAVFAALGVDGLRRRLRDPEELRELFGIEVIGEIPRVRSFPAHPSDVMSFGSNPFVHEAYQRLRTNFELLLLSKQLLSVSITSYDLGEGKTTVSANLAWTIASLGQEVVAVDGDLRRPRLHEALDVDGRYGLTGIKAGDQVSAVQQPTALPSLTVIPAGTSDRHPTELVATTFPRVLGALEAPNRFVIVDSPPLVVAETVLLAAMTRAVVLVVDVSQRDPDDIGKALAELRQAGAEVLGVVLNRSRRRQSRRGSEYYYQHLTGTGRRRRKEVPAAPVPGPAPGQPTRGSRPKTPSTSGDKT